MKKIKNYSTQYKIIQPAQLRDSSRTQLHNQNQNHGKNSSKPHKKTLSKDRQEFINNISASGFKQFNL